LEEIAEKCVVGFPLSSSRAGIMAGLRSFVRRLQDVGIKGDIWIDGSFLTEKIDPKDVDVVLVIQAADYDYGNDETRAAIDWVVANQKNSLRCDSYVLFEYPADSPLLVEGQWWYSYLHARWGFSYEGDPKGIAVVKLPGDGT
jgi:hypothetical protein